MVYSIEIDRFSNEVAHRREPFLLAYIGRLHQFKEQKDVLDQVSSRFSDRLGFYLLNESYKGEIRKLGIEGSPTFILFNKGKQIGRLLGRADVETLESFIIRFLSFHEA